MAVSNRILSAWLLAVGSLVLTLVVLLVVQKGRTGLEVRATPSTTHDPISRLSTNSPDDASRWPENNSRVDGQPRSSHGSLPSAAKKSSTIVLRGQVKCSATGIPILAAVNASSHTYFSHPYDGSFAVALPTAVLPVEVSVEAPGYAKLSRHVEATEHFLQFDLVPIAQSIVRVVDESGRPIPGAQIELAATEDRGRFSRLEPLVIGESDAEGSCTLRTALPQTLLAQKGSCQSNPTTCIPGQTCMLVVNRSASVVVGVYDVEADRPLAGAGVQLLEHDTYPSVSFGGSTNPAGVLDASLPRGRYELRVTDSDLDVLEANRQDSRFRTAMAGSFLDVSTGPDSVWILAKRSPGRKVRLLDANTHEPLNRGRAWLVTRLEGQEAWIPMGKAFECQLRAGLLPLAALNIDAMAASASIALSVSAPGHDIALLSDPWSEIQVGAVKDIELARAQVRSIRVLTLNSNQWIHPLRIIEAEGLTELWTGVPSEDGLAGPFDWHGSDVVVTPASTGGREIGRVPGSVLREEGVPTVMVDASCEIDVQVRAESIPVLFCRSEDGTSYQGVAKEDSTVSFESLVPGRYEIGTPEQLRTSTLRRIHGDDPLSIELRSGQRRVIAWSDLWTEVPVLEGHVEISGISLDGLFVAPVYEPIGVPMAGGRAHQRYPVRSNGDWRMENLHGRPTQVFVGSMSDDGREVPLGFSEPGAPLLLQCSKVGLQFPDTFLDRRIRVRYQPDPSRRKLVVDTVHERRNGRDMTLERVPCTVREIFVDVGSRSFKIDVRLRPGYMSQFQMSDAGEAVGG